MKKGVSKNTKKQLWNILFVALLVAVTVIVLVKSNEELNFETLKDFFSGCKPAFIAAAAVCMLLFILFEGLSLHLILRKLGYKSKIASSIAYSTADVYYSAITPSATGGQPASAYYMVKDGVDGGTAGFSLVFNLVAYTAAILVIGLTVFIVKFQTFLSFDFWVKVFIVVGLSVQTLLLVFFILCMRCHGAVLKCGNAIISLLKRIKIVKNDEKWRKKFEGAVDKYRSSFEKFRGHKFLFLQVLLLNIAQRASLILVSCFVCAAASAVNMAEVFALQAFVVLGYNSVPLPGGIGVFEYLYLRIYGGTFESAFILVAMMVTRVISYYCSMLISGIYTIIYHVAQIRHIPPEQLEEREKSAEEAVNVLEETSFGFPEEIPPEKSENTITNEENKDRNKKSD